MADLHYLNLRANGLSDKAAKARIAEEGKASPKEETKPKEPSTADKKAALALEIEALGGEVPTDRSSLAKFEEALEAAKKSKETTPEATGVETGEPVKEEEETSEDLGL